MKLNDVFVRGLEVNAAVGKIGYINLIWDISKINDHIKKESIAPTKVDIRPLTGNIIGVEVNKKRALQVADSDEPIILCYEPMFNDYVIVDGNHRVIGAALMRKTHINAYVLPDRMYIHPILNMIAEEYQAFLSLVEEEAM